MQKMREPQRQNVVRILKQDDPKIERPAEVARPPRLLGCQAAFSRAAGTTFGDGGFRTCNGSVRPLQ